MKTSKQTIFNLGRIFSLILLTSALFVACSKDKNEDSTDAINRDDFSRSYFDVRDGEFSGKALPASNTSAVEVLSVTGGSTVLAGGSNIIRVMANDEAREVIVGVKGKSGYFTLPMTQVPPRGGDAVREAAIRILISQELRESFTLAIAVGDGNGNFGTYEFLEVNLMTAGTGKLQISIQWDKLNDVDLHMVEPNGERIYYGNPRSANGGELDVDSNPACYIDNINNENITYAHPDEDPTVVVENGEYHVMLDLYSNCGITGNTSYTVVARYNGLLIEPTSGTNPSEGFFQPSDESGDTNHRSIMKFNINGTGTKTLPGNATLEASPKVVKFDVDNSNKVFQNFSVTKG